jgi:hypothetical protein
LNISTARSPSPAFQKEVDRLVPGLGETFGAAGGADLVGAAHGATDGVGSLARTAALRELSDEAALDLRRPAVVMVRAAVYRREIEQGLDLGIGVREALRRGRVFAHEGTKAEHFLHCKRRRPMRLPKVAR